MQTQRKNTSGRKRRDENRHWPSSSQSSATSLQNQRQQNKESETRKEDRGKTEQGRQTSPTQRRKRENTEEGASIQPAAPQAFITIETDRKRGGWRHRPARANRSSPSSSSLPRSCTRSWMVQTQDWQITLMWFRHQHWWPRDCYASCP